MQGKDGKLAVTKTLNAVNPVCNGETPLLTVDVWEHVSLPVHACPVLDDAWPCLRHSANDRPLPLKAMSLQ